MFANGFNTFDKETVSLHDFFLSFYLGVFEGILLHILNGLQIRYLISLTFSFVERILRRGNKAGPRKIPTMLDRLQLGSYPAHHSCIFYKKFSSKYIRGHIKKQLSYFSIGLTFSFTFYGSFWANKGELKLNYYERRN